MKLRPFELGSIVSEAGRWDAFRIDVRDAQTDVVYLDHIWFRNELSGDLLYVRTDEIRDKYAPDELKELAEHHATHRELDVDESRWTVHSVGSADRLLLQGPDGHFAAENCSPVSLVDRTHDDLAQIIREQGSV